MVSYPEKSFLLIDNLKGCSFLNVNSAKEVILLILKIICFQDKLLKFLSSLFYIFYPRVWPKYKYIFSCDFNILATSCF